MLGETEDKYPTGRSSSFNDIGPVGAMVACSPPMKGRSRKRKLIAKGCGFESHIGCIVFAGTLPEEFVLSGRIKLQVFSPFVCVCVCFQLTQSLFRSGLCGKDGGIASLSAAEKHNAAGTVKQLRDTRRRRVVTRSKVVGTEYVLDILRGSGLYSGL